MHADTHTHIDTHKHVHKMHTYSFISMYSMYNMHTCNTVGDYYAHTQCVTWWADVYTIHHTIN